MLLILNAHSYHAKVHGHDLLREKELILGWARLFHVYCRNSRIVAPVEFREGHLSIHFDPCSFLQFAALRPFHNDAGRGCVGRTADHDESITVEGVSRELPREGVGPYFLAWYSCRDFTLNVSPL